MRNLAVLLPCCLVVGCQRCAAPSGDAAGGVEEAGTASEQRRGSAGGGARDAGVPAGYGDHNVARVNTALFSPDGKLIFTGGDRVWPRGT
jgi:hypothetical protein